MNKAAFLDRDGVINRKAAKGEYITRWKDMHFLPGVVEAIKLLHQAGFLVVVITNQRCVAKGQISIAGLEALHVRMSEELSRSGANLDAIYYCPHEKQPVCDCRKPAPGMLLAAAREYDIDLAASWMIGDSDIDIEAGRSAGCKTARLLEADQTAGTVSNVVSATLLQAVEKIISLENFHRSTAPSYVS